METFVNIAIPAALIMVVAAALLAVILPLIKSLGEPKVLLKSLLGIAAIAVVFLIAWAISDAEVTAKYASQGITDTGSKLVGGALTTMYILFILAVIGIVYSEFNKALK